MDVPRFGGVAGVKHPPHPQIWALPCEISETHGFEEVEEFNPNEKDSTMKKNFKVELEMSLPTGGMLRINDASIKNSPGKIPPRLFFCR